MPFDSVVLAAVAREIEQSLLGDRVQTVFQTGPLELLLGFTHRRRLLLSASAEQPSAYLASLDRPHPPQPPPFCMQLRKHLEGARLRAVRQPHFDRILELEFARGEERWLLVSEIMGRHSNILLLDSAGVITGLIKPVPSSLNRYRSLRAGAIYVPPPDGGRLDPITTPPAQAVAALLTHSQPHPSPATTPPPNPPTAPKPPAAPSPTVPELSAAPEGAADPSTRPSDPATSALPDLPAIPDLRTSRPPDLRTYGPDLLRAAWFGMSPALCAWLQAEAAGSSTAGAGLVSPPDLERALAALQSIVTAGAFKPVWIEAPTRLDLWALPPASPGPAQVRPWNTMSAAAEAFYQQQADRTSLIAARTTLLKRLESALHREERKQQDFQKLLRDADQATLNRTRADALLAYPDQVPDGATTVILPDPAGGEQQLHIPLDAELTPRENATRLYDRARSSERAAREIAARAVESNRLCQQLRDAVERASAAASLDELQRAQAGLPEAMREPSRGSMPALTPAPGKPEPELPAGIRRVVAESGHEILWGRTAADNDVLTGKIARPNDLWLHVRGDTSAHVVIRTNNAPDRIPRTTLLQAAAVAAANSPAKHSSYVAVDYTLRKYIVKRRGSKPGSVEYRMEKTLHVSGAGAPTPGKH